MPPTYLLARDHLERAASILEREQCTRSRELQSIIERTIELLIEMEHADRRAPPNVVDFDTFRYARGRRPATKPGRPLR